MSRTLPLLLLGLPLPALAAEEGGSDATMVVVLLAVLVAASGALLVARRAWGLAAAAVSGLFVAGWLTVQHYQAQSGVASICNISSTWNCDVVNTSQWSEIGSVPIALIGMGYFATVAFLALRHAMGRAPAAPGLIVGLSGLAVAYDVFLAWATFQIGAFCILCITTWVLNAMLLVGGLLALRGTGQAFPVAFRAALKETGDYAFIVGLATVVLGGMALRKTGPAPVQTPDQGGRVEDLAAYYEQPAGTVLLDGTEPVYGDPGAPYTLVEFADYECPHCAIMAKELKRVLEANKDVKLLFKHFPLAPACNKNAPYGRHENACNAAAAAECARQQGRFWELSGAMFENQQYLGKDDLRFMAQQARLDMAAFEQCMSDPATAQAVIADTEAGGAARVEGTPTVFLKGPWGDQWVRLTGGEDAMNAIFTVARSGTPLPPPPPAPPREER